MRAWTKAPAVAEDRTEGNQALWGIELIEPSEYLPVFGGEGWRKHPLWCFWFQAVKKPDLTDLINKPILTV